MRFRGLIVAFIAICLSILTACGEAPTNVSVDELTYDEILNTGLANKCQQISEFTRGSIPIEGGASYIITDVCLEPQEFFVKEEPVNKREKPEFIAGKLLTRSTTSLEQISGTIAVGENGILTFTENDGIDFQPVTVQLPSGEQVPFFFTMKGFVGKAEASPGTGSLAINSSTDFEGDFKVPSYRGSAFLDPKGRGLVSGYDNAVALPAGADSSEFSKANVKKTPVLKGTMSLQVTRVDGSTGELSGVFESVQPSDTDLGSKEPVDVKIRGIFYGRIESKV